MKIAVVGTGISGLSAAWLLRQTHEVTVFESQPRPGGHTNTQRVDEVDGPVWVDTGFIVHNDRNYPRLVSLFDLLGIPTQPSDMSFSASLNAGAVEYAGDALFAQKSNFLRPTHWRMLLDVMRFNRLAKTALTEQTLTDVGLGEWLDQHRFSAAFEQRYLLPMAASIWSSPSDAIREFSAEAFVEFFNNHGLLDLSNRPQWKTVPGGSINYLNKLLGDLEGHVRIDCGVAEVVRDSAGITVKTETGETLHFDAIVFGCHADETLRLMTEPDPAEKALLASFKFRPNRALLHSDKRLMPKRRQAWSSWNYLTQSQEKETNVSVTYWMNRLQRLQSSRDYFVTLNPLVEPNPELVHYETEYTHPVFDQATRRAQRSLGLLQGHNNCWYCGAWMGYGFHEDGLGSAIEAAVSLGVELPGQLNQARLSGPPYMDNHHPWQGPGSGLINDPR